MKELSIEEKAKRYDDLLVKLQEAKVDNNVCDDRYCCVIDDIVPELKESERIELLNYLYDVHDDDEERARWIAWLEKQGEQKPAEWSGTDIMYLENLIAMVDAKEYPEYIKWLISIRDRVQPQPKQEWDGGDEAHLHSLITHLEQWIERHPNTTGADIQGENITWLKSLRPQMQWKAVDKEIYVKEPALAQRKDKSEPNHGYVICYDHTLTPDVYERFIMISDIYNQSHWKPSDEQIKVMTKIKAGIFYMCLKDISGYDSFTKGKVYSSIYDNALINDNHIEVKVMNSEYFRIASDKEIFKAKLDRLKEETYIGLSEHDNGVKQGRMEVISALYGLLDSMKEKPTTSVWHDISEEANLSEFVILYDEKDGYMSPPCRFPFKDMSGFVDAMNRKYGAHYTKWAYKDDLLKL